MSQTDPIAELLTRIRNAMRARFNELIVDHSRIREAICRVLAAEGFLDGVEVGGEAPKRKLILKLRYSASREPVIRGIQRVSKPSVRRYAGADEIGRSRGERRAASASAARSCAGYGDKERQMSRIGRLPVKLDKSVKAQLQGDTLKVEGPKGKLEIKVHPGFTVEIK